MRTLVSGATAVVLMSMPLSACVEDVPSADETDPGAFTTSASFCPTGFSYDGTNLLCTSATEAVAPFPRSMVDDCKRFVANRANGTNACETTVAGAVSTRWARSLAIGARSRTVQPSGCSAGTTRSTSGYCGDAANLYGPFTKNDVTFCKAHGGGSACETNRIAPTLVAPRTTTSEWSYILPLDYGVREDDVGGGAFGAARGNSAGTHSGVDFLAPVGTSLFSPCASDDVQVGFDSGYGNWVQIVCPAPASLSGGRTAWASLLYGHLSSVAVSDGGSISRGGRIGAVGKTGNAADPAINAHVHFEITIQDTQQGAHDDLHGSADNTGTVAATNFESSLRAACLTPNGVTALTGPVRRGRRPDPYLVLICSVTGKPALTSPPASLQGTLDRWSANFSASGFDVDVGR